MAESSTTLIALLVVAVVALGLLYFCTTAPASGTEQKHTESYTDYTNNDLAVADLNNTSGRLEQQRNEEKNVLAALENVEQNEGPVSLLGNDVSNTAASVPKDCFPKDQLSPEELLPADSNSMWAQVNPCGQGNLGDNNLLTAGHHVGINTVGQTLRNANLQLRSEPPNPQVKVSPWLQSTIEPDTNRRAMEIGGSCAN